MFSGKEKKEILVSVCILVYNHEKFLKQTFDSILMQKTNFAFEIVIGEDCSSDNSRAICIEYKQQHPDLITLLLPDQNQGVVKNCISTLENCRGKYIAFCEGDDYWTDPYKLQKQVDFLEANPDYSLVFHQVQTLSMSTNTFGSDFFNHSPEIKTYTIKDLAKGNFIHTPSVMLIKSSIDYRDIDLTLPVSDYYLWLSSAEKGKIAYLPDIMSVYRIWNESVWETKSIVYKAKIWIRLLEVLLKKYGGDVDLHAGLFHQLNSNYRTIYQNTETLADSEELDKLTKKLLLIFLDFRIWWFSYMVHLGKERRYKLKYLFYLIKERARPSASLWKKALV
ncbi:MAG: glycosyltransferase [Dysgonomonas sp.]|nr:glycosyltransferase [Dysgonomonas sp.]